MKKYISYITAFVLFCVTLYIATQCRYPEIDELFFVDAPANFLLNGGWKSHILYSEFLYQPLHAILLIPWMFIFGVSHFSECAFGVLMGFITCILIVKYAKKLNYINTIQQELAIVISFWAFNTFTDYETFGRPDNLGMLITSIIVYMFLKYPNIQHWKSFVLGVVLISVGVIEIPIITFFFLFMILLSIRQKNEVIKWVRKGFDFVLGLAAGELLVCVFFFYNKGTALLRYIQHTFFSGMNANFSSSSSFFERLFDAYSENWYITAIFIFIIVVLLIRKIGFNKKVAFFVILLPALMVLAGRYLPYYAWLYYIPMCVFLAYTLREHFKIAALATTLIVVSGAAFFASQWYTTYGCQTGTIKELELIKRDSKKFFDAHRDIIAKYDNVVLSEEQLYYHVINAGAEVWFQYRKNNTHKIDFYNYQHMEIFNTPVVEGGKYDQYSNHPTYGPLVRYYLKYNANPPYFPQQGICIYTCDFEKDTSLEFMEHFGYNYKCIMEDGNYSIYSFEKN